MNGLTTVAALPGSGQHLTSAAAVQPEAPKDAEIRFLGDLQRLRPEPGDMFVLSTEHSLSVNQHHQIERWLSGALGGAKVLILSQGVKLGVVGDIKD